MLLDKLNEFKTAIDAIKVAIIAKGVAVTTYTLATASSLVEQIQTSRSMGTKTVSIEQRVPVTMGVKITESESDPEHRVSYIGEAQGMIPVTVDLEETGNADYGIWKNSWLFEKIYPVMLKTDGTIDYRLDPNDQTKKITGESSDVSNINYDGNAMVCVEKFYTKFSMDGENEVIEISPTKQSGFDAIGFIRSDDSEADRIFLPMFLGYKDSKNKLRSISGNRTSFYNIKEARTAAQKNGSNYDIESYAMNIDICSIFTILMKTCNARTSIGEGNVLGRHRPGCLKNKGAIAYDTETKATKFMWIEDFTSDYASNNGTTRHETGLLGRSGYLYVKMKPPYSITSLSGQRINEGPLDSGYVKSMKCSNEYGRFPVETGTGDTNINTYECANYFVNNINDIRGSERAMYCGVWGHLVYHEIDNNMPNSGSAGLTYLPPA